MKDRRKDLDFLFFAYHGALGLVVGLAFIVLANTIFQTYSVIKEMLNSLGGAFVIGTVFDLVYTKISRDIYLEDIKYLVDREKSGFRRLFPRSDDPEAVDEIIDKLKHARDIQMYGIALNILWRPEVIEILKDRVMARQARVKIFLADPESPNIKARLAEESAFPYPTTEGEQAIRNVLAKMQTIASIDPERFSVCKFHHYPTLAILIIDQDIFVYAYGYKTVGTVSPMLHLHGLRTPQAQFYVRQIETLTRDYLQQKVSEGNEPL